MTDADALREGAAQERPPQPGSPAPAAAPAGDGKVMSLVDHLSELRNRLFKCLIAVGIGSVVGLVAVERHHRRARGAGRRQAPQPRPGRRVRDHAPRLARDRDRPRDAGPALPALGVHRAGPDDRRAAGDPAVDPARAGLLRRRRARSPISSCRTRWRSSTASRHGTFANLPAAGPYFDFVTTLFLAFGLIMEFPIVLYRPVAGRTS